jgi:hypothetical protein
MKTRARWILASIILVSLALSPAPTHAQGRTKWLKAGSLHNWYSEYGCEIEIGNDPSAQQFGLRWPTFYDLQDMQAAKSLWLGATDFTDDKGNPPFAHKVVHVGPRVNGVGEFFPVSFDLYVKYPHPAVLVDGILAIDELPKLTAVDPTLPCDRMIVNVVNTAIGVTMTRTIYAFSSPLQDNYHITKYVFKNTGNTDADPEIELPAQTITGFYAYYMYRYSVNRQIGYMINLHSTWGYNAMTDTRGVPGIDPPTVDPLTSVADGLRCQFTWHGKDLASKSQTVVGGTYDNIGAPIGKEGPTLCEQGFISSGDTVGRLGGAQFVGNSTLFASQGPGAQALVNDPGQPSTTAQEGSDDLYTSSNDHLNRPKMTGEYTSWITRGHRAPRHAWRVIPSGDFALPTSDPGYGDPALTTQGGWSIANGYGPYTLAPGDSVVVVLAEGAAGLSPEECIRIGRNYIRGIYDARTKNDSVVTKGRDRLFETFRRARENYASNFSFAAPPPPPRSVTITSRGNRVLVEWQSPAIATPAVAGYNIYRADVEVDSTYRLIYKAGPNETSFEDTTLARGVPYYYTVTSFGDPVPMNTAARPNAVGTVVLESNPYYTRAYRSATLTRPPGTSMSQIRIVPNPYTKAANSALLYGNNLLGWDNIKFYDIPDKCRIRIFTELGEEIAEVLPPPGTGDASWNSITKYGQVIKSGIYLVLFENLNTGERIIKKLVVVR